MQIDGQKLWLHPDRLTKALDGQPVVPIYVEISPTGRCNHRCIFCAVDFARGHDELDLRATELAIREMGALGVKSIMFGGDGEPFLHKGLINMVEMAKISGIDVAITTNGSIMPEDWYRFTDACSWIKFSVDAATEDTYKKVHRGGSLLDALYGIKVAVDARRNGSCKLGAQMLLLEENVREAAAFTHQMHKLGMDYVVLKPWSKHPRTVSDFSVNTENVLYKVHTEDFCKEIEVIFRTHQFWPSETQKCRALPFWAYIRANGDVECCSIRAEEDRVAGNIYRSNMRDIIYGLRRSKYIHWIEDQDCCSERPNCRMARVNEYMDRLCTVHEHENFI